MTVKRNDIDPHLAEMAVDIIIIICVNPLLAGAGAGGRTTLAQRAAALAGSRSAWENALSGTGVPTRPNHRRWKLSERKTSKTAKRNKTMKCTHEPKRYLSIMRIVGAGEEVVEGLDEQHEPRRI